MSLGQVSRRDEDDLPAADDPTGQLIAGPGAGGLQPRPSEAKRALPKLTRPQEEALAKSKRFAMEQSVQHVSFLFLLNIVSIKGNMC